MGMGRMLRRGAALAACAGIATLAAAPVAGAAGRDDRYEVTIRRTAQGVPHIRARDYASLGYGYGHAIAQDNLCTLADTYVTVRAQRSRFFGPDGSYDFRGNGTKVNNLNSDFFYQRIIDERTVERLLAQPVPHGPRPEIRAIVRGYVAGYNRYLRDTGVDRLPDPRCRGKEWVGPIEEIDAYRRFYQLALLASQGAAIDGIAAAAPVAQVPSAEASAASLRGLDPSVFPLGGLGSNAYGLGREATASGHGMVLGNPHFPWDGSERFYQAHLTVPGRLNVSGASLFGVPLVLIGHNRLLAWSHTVSTAFRFTPFELTLVPGSPTTYLYDGEPREMTAKRVTVKVQAAGGRLEDRTRTLHSTVHGPVFTSILGLPLFPWTPSKAYAMGDANAGNFRYLNHFFETDRARSVRALDAVLRRNQGIPWVNTIAADARGEAYYADISVVPNVSDAKAESCGGVLGRATFPLLGLPVLDGARSACRWDEDADAAQPGIIGPSRLPSLFRADYVTNSNDSYWLSNPEQPLEGYPRIVGAERTARSLRTRLGLVMVRERLDGSDGRQGRRFTLHQLQDTVFSNRQYAAELWRDEAVAMCREHPTVLTSAGPVDVSAGCDVLAAWDRRDDLDSRGAVLWRRFATRVLGGAVAAANAPGFSSLPVGGAVPSPFTTPFSAADPVDTPRGLDTGSPVVQAALGDAVRDLRESGIPLDARLREYQYDRRGDQRIPIHGGPGGVGVFNAISAPWVKGEGFPDVVHGSSFVMAAELTGGCPRVRTILTYSLSENPDSPHFADQTRMYSDKRWVRGRFCEREIAVDPELAVTRLRGR